MYRKHLKQMMDRTLALVGCMFLLIPMVIIGICIIADSKGPIIFKQTRLGKNKKPFEVLKFRSMCEHAYEMGGIAESERDSRITKVGAYLRSSSFDELPQLFNVIKGQMAIIGPRPLLEWQFEEYSKNEQYHRRFDVLPGMFCTVDLEYRAQADRDLQFSMDVEYVDNISFKTDLRVLLGIVKMVISKKNIYRAVKKDG